MHCCYSAIIAKLLKMLGKTFQKYPFSRYLFFTPSETTLALAEMFFGHSQAPWPVSAPTEYAEFNAGAHSIIRVKLAQADEVGGARPPPFSTLTITSKVAVYDPAEWADTLTLFKL
jgi:hypothetical protein